MKIAIYGKGGIGKSTISANLSAALAASGKKVFQIGCDPKCDLTRLLLNARSVTTALDYMRNEQPKDQQINDILYMGYSGVTRAKECIREHNFSINYSEIQAFAQKKTEAI